MECLRNRFSGGILLDGGRYETISPLNHGSFGMVFMARDRVTDQTVAIKCITWKSATDDACLDLAIDDRSEEYALHSSLGSHPNIVNLLNKFETDAHLFLVMEFCSQGDLYEAIRHSHGPLQTEHVRQFMLELVDAVAYIHSRGIYHRDIKPENIFLTQDGAMKLGDFGLATVDKWSYETTVGSDRYMAPEQFDSAGDGYSPAAADIWAIGICLLNILFSRNPFTTPTEADPIFLDFSRDKQSLFDVFPTMSQDTYEVIVECMNLDPKKRSLEGARAALRRVVSFTTEDESLDDFCCAEKTTVVSAHREPLRTPSIQSPQVEGGSFPWAKALHEAPARRQLSAIPDDESYAEDLFSKSGETMDWCSTSIQTPSSSVLDSHLGASMAFHDDAKLPQPYKVSPTAGSLPISMGKPFVPAMSSVFGGRKKEAVSKSWSEMWEEDEEEEREQRKSGSRQQMNSRTWSRDSSQDAGEKLEKVEIVASHVIRGDVDDDLVADGFFFHESSPPRDMGMGPRYSPPPKRNQVDKWTALGERRRGLSQSLEHHPMMEQAKPLALKQRRPVFGYKTQDEAHKSTWTKERLKDIPFLKAKDWNWRRQRRPDLDEGIEWVGGW